MPDFDRDRLLHYCRLLGDADQGRRLGAARGITTFLKDQGLDWDDLIVQPVTVAGHTFAATANAKAATTPTHVTFVTELLAGHAAGTLKLSDWEKQFCENMKDWQRSPTEKQQAVLYRLEDRLRLRTRLQRSFRAVGKTGGPVP